jgi:hypothetical protein
MLEVYCEFSKITGLLFIENHECPFRTEDGDPDWERFDPLLPDWVCGGKIIEEGEVCRINTEYVADTDRYPACFWLHPLPPTVEVYDEDDKHLYLRLYLPEEMHNAE